MNDPRGSLWRKWDLHVHTPASIVQNYGGGTEEAWDSFFADIELLPPEFKVIGINDYIFLDGYRKVLEAKKGGRLANIDLFLPVIELRLDKFGGTTGALSRVNYHVIFSNEIDPELIQHQFLNAIQVGYQLAPQHSHLKWNAVVTRESLTELGQLIIQSVPEEERHRYGSPLKEGFNNLNFSLDRIQECLRFHYFEGMFVTAVGKTEWADIKWTDQSIADKKNIINTADIVFVSAKSIESFHRAQEALSLARVNSRLFDCSDAHSFSDATDKDRIGHCFTWVKADPTFAGLLQALHEPADRIFIGDRPEKLEDIARNKTKYIHSVKIYKKEGADLDEIWFDNEIVFNSELVAIIGNKGTGKSALTDIIALLGNSHCAEFSFLSKTKFRNPRDYKADHFEAILEWEDGESICRGLADKVAEHEVEMVKYIPQHYFEEICNELEVGESSRFNSELKEVIFSHIAEPDRLGLDSLDKLIAYKTAEIQRGVELLKLKLAEINERIIELERRVSPDYRMQLEERIKSKDHELWVHEANQPSILSPPDQESAVDRIISEKREQVAKIESKIAEKRRQLNEQQKLFSLIKKLKERIDQFKRQYETFQREYEAEMTPLGISMDTLVRIEFDRTPLEQMADQLTVRIRTIEKEFDLSNSDGLVCKKAVIEEEIEALQRQLDVSSREYQDSLKQYELWEQKKGEIIGDNETPNSLEYCKEQLRRSLEVLPEKLDLERAHREEISCQIHKEMQKIAAIYEELYAHVQEAINSHDLMRQSTYELSFEVSLEEAQFCDKFFRFISQGVRGTFCGRSEGRKRLKELLALYDFNEQSDIITFLQKILESLEKDLRGSEEEVTGVRSQLRKEVTLQDLYTFLFSLEFLEPRYALLLNGKDLRQLSPGERGVLLLIFYLLVDKNDCPLILDQPEENLDSQSVYELLAPCVKAAKRRRQLFIVTHNPNLAVVCDAEQIVHAFIDKTAGNRVCYTTGAIENPEINKRVVDVLEGTWPAFTNRESKYMQVEGSAP